MIRPASVPETTCKAFPVPGSDQAQRALMIGPWPVHAFSQTFAHRRRLRVDERAITLDSDLSVDMDIIADEVDAIVRLLGDDLKAFLSQA
jgi:hypothetical protein